jgi:hypothetical protein
VASPPRPGAGPRSHPDGCPVAALVAEFPESCCDLVRRRGDMRSMVRYRPGGLQPVEGAQRSSAAIGAVGAGAVLLQLVNGATLERFVGQVSRI